MTVGQLPGQVREFAGFLNGLMTRVDQGGGWCAVFWQRDPDGMRACLEGRELPPWDVVEALLHDLANARGSEAAAAEAVRARALHAEAVDAFDALPGARDALSDRLDVMLREQRYAAERQAQLRRALAAAGPEEAEALRVDLAWANDDHERATARCAELRSRIERLERGPVTAPPGVPARPGAPAPSARPAAPASPAAAAAVRTPAVGGTAAGPARAAGAARAAGPARVPGPAPAVGPSDGVMHGGSVRPEGQDLPAPEPVPDTDDSSWDASARVPHQRAGGTASARAPHPQGPEGSPAPGAAPRGGTSWTDADALAEAARRRAAEWTAAAERSPWETPAAPAAAAPQPAVPPLLSTPPAANAPEAPAERPQAPTASSGSSKRKRRRGSARFAGGVEEEETTPVAVPPPMVPVLPAPVSRSARTLRGARFAGVAETVPDPQEQPRVEKVDEAARQEIMRAVATLRDLRDQGRSGEAHVLLIEVAHWPAARYPVLAEELERAGLTHDWSTLLWEAASMPAEELVAVYDALIAAGRGADAAQALRQGVARPAVEIGTAVLTLTGEHRMREARVLLDTYVRVRTPDEAVRSVLPDPEVLVPLLLDAGQRVSEDRYWDLVHALRVAGYTS